MTRIVPRARAGLAAALALLLSGCPGVRHGEGGDGQPCFPNDTCDPGLVCRDGVCETGEVGPGDGPVVTLSHAPPAVTNQTTAHFEIDCDRSGCLLVCRLGDGEEGPCVSPVVLGRLPDGEHVLTVRGLTLDGLSGEPVSHGWRVDTAPPVPTFVEAPPPRTRSVEAVFDLVCDEECRTECSLDGALRAPCTFPLTLTDLPDGERELEVVAFDLAGNRGEARHGWEVDAIPPRVTLLSAPEAETAFRTAAFELECDKPGCEMYCRLDGGAEAPCESPHMIEDLDLGEHLFEARAADDLGPGDWAPHRWRVVPNRWASLGAGFHRSCGVRLDGTLWCWGRPADRWISGVSPESQATPTPVGTAGGWVAVSSGGEEHACALRQDATLWCWGRNGFGQVGDGSRAEREEPVPVDALPGWTQVSTGGHSTCALREDEEAGLWCWGQFHQDWPTPVADGVFRQVSVGGTSRCALREDGTLWCFGRNSHGQVGDGTTTDRDLPVQVGEESDWEAVAVGGAHACGLRGGGQLWCWGRNSAGQVGDGSEEPARHSPVRVGGDTRFASVGSGGSFSCAVDEEGQAWCWGEGRLGQLGDPALEGSPVPVPVAPERRWLRLTLGRDHACGIDDAGGSYCWGFNGSGQMGDGVSSDKQRPHRAEDGGGWARGPKGSGNFHGCGLRDGGALWCWGFDQWGQMGADVSVADLPVVGGGGLAFDQVAVGALHTCGLAPAGELWCFGRNEVGQLGDGTTEEAADPVLVGSGWAEVAVGNFHTCARRDEGTLWCWGRNGSGQLGVGTEEDSPAPVQVGEATDWSFVAAGASHACGLRSPGSLWCWGHNGWGQLGDGTKEHRFEPVRVGAAEDWVEVVSGQLHTCGRRDDGTLWCWGLNHVGQAGTGSDLSEHLDPARVGEESDWEAVAVANAHTCGLRGGTLWCWGHNGSGQLGVGTLELSNVPVEISDETGWTGLSLLSSATCAFRDDGSRWCWGANGSAQLGDGTRLRLEPAGVLEP